MFPAMAIRFAPVIRQATMTTAANDRHAYDFLFKISSIHTATLIGGLDFQYGFPVGIPRKLVTM